MPYIRHMLKYTTSTLSKIEGIFKESDYAVRYGKGNFKSGSAMIHEKRVVVVNKMFDLEARISHLVELLTQVDLNEENLSDASLELLKKIAKSREA